MAYGSLAVLAPWQVALTMSYLPLLGRGFGFISQ